ncbi:MAG: RNA-binding S4 domain-containing protein [Halobacteriovoraceae bacterium]|nr:RNA-binding S4 domain-containing protein [Halobacteriovoraceae bacterium]
MEYELKGKEFIPLCDLLKIMNLCQSGGDAKFAISEGEVLVDGEVELRKRCKIRQGQKVEFAGQAIQINS